MSRMVSDQARLPWLTRLQQTLFACPAPKGYWARPIEKDEYLFVTKVADELVECMKIWAVEARIEILAHIACWHRHIQTYRGHVLCSDTAGRTFLIDGQSWGYVKSAATHLLQIDGVDQAKRFVDALWEHRPENGGEHVAFR
ncbi:hypothetical protein KDA_75120 [Dictyobacter alpinus]|uniref:Uncharacterized protein n=1 Tax=Dictyobacter alpinus TaxID=2014873 RepID=A0A402BKY4_9CHLR|nr:hypothetical protein [Dictyobacter alpinus]GCE32028.1 hypothetical protein KDA_75120 [Dictyobacter alpinus]